jgi:hypothetical protein
LIQVFAPNGILGDPLQILPVAGVAKATGVSAAAEVLVNAITSSGAAGQLRGIETSSDAVAILGGNQALATAAFLFGFNDAANQFQRIRAQADSADALATGIGHLAVMGHGLLFNGATWDRMRSLDATNLGAFSGLGGLISAGPGEWAIQHQPAAATQATITRAAGGAGVRHVCRSITVSLLAVAAQGQIIVNLRDGGTGAGTILWSAGFVLAAGSSDRIALSGLNIVGTANTAMTLEFAAAPAATNFAQVALSGYDCS